MRTYFSIIPVFLWLLANGCTAPRINLFPGPSPLEEFIIQGTEEGKVLVIPISGIISDSPEEEFFYTNPSMVQEVVSQLRLAEKDEEVRAVLL